MGDGQGFAEHLLEWTILPSFGVFEAVDRISSNDSYYLIRTEKKQYLVRVSREFLDTTELARPITEINCDLNKQIYKILHAEITQRPLTYQISLS